jgi:hypothetical protein
VLYTRFTDPRYIAYTVGVLGRYVTRDGMLKYVLQQYILALPLPLLAIKVVDKASRIR